MTDTINTADPKVWIVSTGTEILQGHYADTNAQWLSARLLELALPVARHLSIPDSAADLESELRRASQDCDLIVMTGGLGPTADDLNREAVAVAYETELEENAEALAAIEERFKKRERPMPPGNRVQALIPIGAKILPNKWGTAPGFIIGPQSGNNATATLIALPGPPREMRPMFDELVEPHLREHFPACGRLMETLTLNTAGISESEVNDKMHDLFGSDPSVTVALLAGKWRVNVRLTLSADNPEAMDELKNRWRVIIAERLEAKNIFGEGQIELPEAVGKLLRKRGETLALAESCTGGLIAKQITDVAGSSDYFVEGFVTYSNEAKIRSLGIDKASLDEHGAVSQQVAEQMAAGARRVTGSDWAVSVTGIAGPGGGTIEKPVGLAYIGIASPDGDIRVKKILSPDDDRQASRDYTAVVALDLLRRAINRAS